MMDLNFKVTDEYLVREELVEPNIVRNEIIADKSTFKEMYRKWILEEQEEVKE